MEHTDLPDVNSPLCGLSWALDAAVAKCQLADSREPVCLPSLDLAAEPISVNRSPFRLQARPDSSVRVPLLEPREQRKRILTNRHPRSRQPEYFIGTFAEKRSA